MIEVKRVLNPQLMKSITHQKTKPQLRINAKKRVRKPFKIHARHPFFS